MLSVSYAGKNSYIAGKTSGVLRGGASGANRCYVLAHCALQTWKILSEITAILWQEWICEINNGILLCK